MDVGEEPPTRSTSLRRNMSKSSQIDGKPKRQRSLVRPERERNDPNNRLYHYRQRATTETPTPAPIQPLRRGKSILGREEKGELEQGAIYFEQKQRKNCSLWMTYCILLTCCIPKQLLRCVGKSTIHC